MDTVWNKSTFSSSTDCVEARIDGDRIEVRDTKAKGQGPSLSFTHSEWDAFIKGAKADEFNA